MEEALASSFAKKEEQHGAMNIDAIATVEQKKDTNHEPIIDSATATIAVETKEEMNGCTETVASITNSPSRRTPTGKKHGAVGLFRAVFFTFRRHRSSSKKGNNGEKINATDKPASNEAMWKNFICGVRPLHLHQLEYHPSAHPLLPPPPPLGHEVYHDVMLTPSSPARSEGISRYASAEDLHKFSGAQDGEEEENVAVESDGCPNAIDMQAEEFIAKFYEQMRLQRLESSSLAD